jgi:CubicO group peptidase (beta-lactamase class C family)
MRFTVLAFVLAGLLAQPVLAQTPRPPTLDARTMAAGYKALMVCGAVHNARANGAERTVDSVTANELTGIYGELDPIVRDLPVEVTPDGAHVPGDGDRPERRAAYVGGRGCAVLPVGGATRAVSEPLERRFIRADWTIAAPADPAALDQAMTRARDGTHGEGTNTTALVVVQDGRIVGEWYADGFGPDVPQRTWSVAKSLAGTVIGAAVHAGQADVAAPATIPAWQSPGDPRAAITLDDLMRMASGLTSDTAGNRTDGLYFGGTAIADQTPSWPLTAAPGSRYRYANNDTLLATLAVASSFDAQSPNQLFDRLGMTHTVAETDWRGDYMLSSQVWSTARDLARFGQLYVDDGMIDGERILPQTWRAHVSTPSGPQPTGEFGYGATFWLMNRSEGIPSDTIAAFGNRGQYVVIVPSRRIVIVRRGEDPAGSPFAVAPFAAEILAALD